MNLFAFVLVLLLLVAISFVLVRAAPVLVPGGSTASPTSETEKCLDKQRCNEIDEVWLRIVVWINKLRKDLIWNTAAGDWRQKGRPEIILTPEVASKREIKPAIKSAAEAEYARWDNGARREFEPEMKPIVTSYFEAGGSLCASLDPIADPWSASFISYVMKKAGVSDFPGRCAHTQYFKAVHDNPGTCRTYPMSERERIVVGDIVCRCRVGDEKCSGDYNNAYGNSHCDIVVNVIGDGKVEVVGGNVNDNVEKRIVDVNVDEPGKEWFGFISCEIQAVPSVSAAGKTDIRGKPTISAATIDKILSEAGSPASGSGVHFVEYGEQYGIDPAFALAFFRQESNYGKVGIATVTKSIGNVIYSEVALPDYSYTAPGKNPGPWSAYNAYENSINGWYHLMTNSKHYFQQGKYTLEEILPVYSPAADGNDPQAYINNVKKSVQEYRQREQQLVGEIPSLVGTPISFKNSILQQACTAESLLCVIPPQNVDKQEAPGIGSCRQGMVQVGNICVDQYEAMLVDKTTGEVWSPYCNPGKEISRLRAVSIAEVVPQSTVSQLEAKQACANAGKRLCTEQQWILVCQGTEGRRYPYEGPLQNGLCNDETKSLDRQTPERTVAEFCTPGHEPFYEKQPVVNGIKVTWNTAPWMLHPKNNQQENSLEPAGSNQACRTPEQVYDLVGNLDEWVDGTTSCEAGTCGIFLGGFYDRSERPGGTGGCTYRTPAHAPSYSDYSLGFRCCATLS